jgi:glycolate oxidase FAD binding subunit
MHDSDFIRTLCTSIQQANSSKQSLQLSAGGSKSFYGNQIFAPPLDVSANIGIVDYEPSELYISARNGTLLSEIESTLEASNQMLPFEPPHFTSQATLGGTVACGLSGPRRAYANSMRDCILGTNIVNGKGEYLQFGGNVMKNVAGYDVSRLMCGAFGTLGILTQISLKVIPKPQSEITIAIEVNQNEALETMNAWMQTQLPISATYFNNDVLYVRIAGLEKTTKKVHENIGGERFQDSDTFWKNIKDHQADFFQTDLPIWRVIIPSNTPVLSISGESCLEWNGGLRWIKSSEDAQHIINQCQTANGHATLFKAKTKANDCLPSISPKLQNLHLNLKSSFDPNHILNPGRMYSWY